MRKIFLLLAILPIIISAQTSREEIYETPEKAGGVYYAYPVTESENTPAPEGFVPFYVSHYGRHGSRYLIFDNDYKWILNLLDEADSQGALTPFGQDVKQRLDSVWIEAEGRGGELTPLGQRQHHDISQRMYSAYPEVFEGEPEITAASTTVMRCAHSMFAFLEGLKELNPGLKITRESSYRNMHYLNYHSKESEKYKGKYAPYAEDLAKFKDQKTQPDRLIKSIFSDSNFVKKNVDPKEFMRGLYWIAVDMQNMETPISFMDAFTPDELFDLWEIHNFEFYAGDSSYPLSDGQHVENAKNLLRNILETADEYINEGKNGATLRFGHDGNIIPLTALLQLPGAMAFEKDPNELYKVYSNFKISPMASNLQIVFFKNAENEVLVKFMLNEREVPIPAKTDIYPFYKWEDAKETMQYLLDTPVREFMPKEYQGIKIKIPRPELSLKKKIAIISFVLICIASITAILYYQRKKRNKRDC